MSTVPECEELFTKIVIIVNYNSTSVCMCQSKVHGKYIGSIKKTFAAGKHLVMETAFNVSAKIL